ncbi:aldo/keto reductase [Kordiimonas marina]|uniref:aldo/keto reductase n=1 Tax=Kordiimonas marina TaxID=2872312 RepID=UPI001FF473DB|nr:aldo/keto reductase [Kordiimonas marina]MCJ9429690.1 aldo/keto reductase [Kordiimonas marina]
MSEKPLPFADRIPLGQGDLVIGPIAYGCWRLQGELRAATALIEAALESGMTLIDTADIYGFDGEKGFGDAESLLGDVLAATPAMRDQMVLATKGGVIPGLPYNSTADYLISACEASLKRLGTDVIDLYQIHRPDFLTPAPEMAAALTRLRDDGKVREVGVSNYSPAQVRALQAHLDFPIASQQLEFSCWRVDPLYDGTLDQCEETGAIALAWSPLAGGRLMTGEAKEAADAPTMQVLLEVLDSLAGDFGVDRAAVALAFTMAHPAPVVPIIGTQSPARIRAATDAFKVGLTRRDWYDILEARLGKPMP